jgi:hypothetical protein
MQLGIDDAIGIDNAIGNDDAIENPSLSSSIYTRSTLPDESPIYLSHAHVPLSIRSMSSYLKFSNQPEGRILLGFEVKFIYLN